MVISVGATILAFALLGLSETKATPTKTIYYFIKQKETNKKEISTQTKVEIINNAGE
jgi:hypothetical protein